MDPEKRRVKKVSAGIFKSLNYEDLLKNMWQVVSNSAIIAILNVIFNLVISRKLGPENYGTLQTLLSINSIILISVSAIGFIITKFVSYYKTRQQFEKMKHLANWAFMFFFIIGLIAFFINAWFSKTLANFLNIDQSIILLFGIIIWIGFLMPIIEGILRGLQEFKFLGRYKLLETTLKTIIVLIIVYVSSTLKPVILGIAISSIITIIFSGYILRKIYISKPINFEMRDVYKYIFPVFIALTSFAILAHIDMILVKHFFDAKTTGYFAAAGMLAKVTLTIALGSAAVMFPKIVEDYNNSNIRNSIISFRNTLKIYLVPAVLITLALIMFPHEISSLIFGVKYDVGGMLGVYAAATMFLGITIIFMMYNLAIKRYSFILIQVFAAVVLIYQINKLHTTLYDIVWTLFVINFAMLIFTLIYNRKTLMENVKM